MLRTEQVMTLTDRMIIAGIANNPANYEGEGEYRYSIPHQEIYFSSANEPNPYDNEEWIPLPSLDPDGSKRAFKNFIRRRWVPSRQKELETFARRRGWDLAMELKYGGGALEDNEAEEWQYVINRELERLVKQFRDQADQPE
jgi:hypothetical protein